MTKQLRPTPTAQISRRGLLRAAAAAIAVGGWQGKAEAVASSSAAVEWRNRQTGMSYCQLGRTGLMISEVICGGDPVKLDNYQHLNLALEMGLRCAEVLGFRALKLQPQYQALNPLSSRSEFFFETALENRLAVIGHTGAGVPFALPSLFIWTAHKFPGLPIILAHSGGSLFVSEAIVAASVCPNIYLELSSLMPHHILTEVLTHLPSSRLMIGSDLPESLETEMSKILTLEATQEVKEDILWNTAARLFAKAG